MPAQPLSQPASKITLNGGVAKTLSDILVSQGALDEAKAKEVKLAEIQTGKTQEEILINKKN